MKRCISFCFLVMFIGSTLGIRIASAGAPGSACSTVTTKDPSSDACKTEILSNPLPELVRPVAYDKATHGASHPRSIIPPKDPLPFPIGWIVREWYYSDQPGESPANTKKENQIPRGMLVYVYASLTVRGRNWHMIGLNHWVPGEIVAVLRFPQRPEGVSGRWITLDLSEQTLVAMEDDSPVFATLISSSYYEYGFTHTGLFQIYARTRMTTFKGPPWAKIPEYVIPRVPDVMFFDKDIALHGAYWHDYFGLPRSHGCVNIPVGDEAWLWNWVSEVVEKDGATDTHFFLPHPEKAPFVYVYRSAKGRDATQ